MTEVNIAAVYEHDPWVDIDPAFQKKLEAAGFKHVDRDEFPEAWYHPDHWLVFSMDDDKHPDYAGDTWLFEWSFYARTDAARKWAKEEKW